MSTVTLEEAQAHLSELIDHLQPGETLVITRNEKPVARLLVEELPKRKPRKAGSAKGMLTIIQDDDEHLKDFEEYMP
ncbi:MAG TPA: type II toxin-antitoxin system Phd/YefM family antitoxin [Gemmataceae bacterium]|nr:type II toxin-antitoxin system Phd/YefM family antitoxin [Gemmataceae bacterium]